MRKTNHKTEVTALEVRGLSSKMSQKRSSTIPLFVLIAGIIDIVLGITFIVDPDLYPQNLGNEASEDLIVLLGYFSIGIGSFLIFASILIFAASYRTGGFFALIGGIISLIFINIISGLLGSLGGWWTLKKVKKSIGVTCPNCGTLNPIAATVCYGCGTPLLIPKEGKVFDQKVEEEPPKIITPPEISLEEGIKCPICGELSPPNSRFCGFCGTPFERPETPLFPIPMEKKKCQTCSTKTPISAIYCLKCGKKFMETSQKMEEKGPIPMEQTGWIMCPFCNKKTPPNSNFDINCGAKL